MSSIVLAQKETGEEWTVGDSIGRGAFSSVFLLTNTKQSVYVGKVANKKNKKDCEFIKKEIEILENLKHNNIVEVITFFESDHHFIMVQSYYEAGDLKNLLKIRKKINEKECQGLFSQILCGLKYLKDSNIIHRDIKPENIFLKVNQSKACSMFHDDDDDEDSIFIYDVRIGDFGFATTINDQKCVRELGTPNFIAPELIGKTGDEYDLDSRKPERLFKIDIWSAGTLFYTCLIGTPPFETDSIRTTYTLIQTCNWKFPEKKIITANAKCLIGNMIRLEPEDRSTIEELIDDPFFII